MNLTKTLGDMNCRSSANQALRKLALVMKLTTAFLLMVVMHVSANSTAQLVNYSAKNESIVKVLNEIRQQTGYDIIYRTPDLKNAGVISIELINDDINASLRKIFSNRPFQFEVEEGTVIITKKSEKPSLSILETTQPPITGMVRSADGQAIAGANLIIKGTKRGTISNADGSFSIDANKGEIIIISSIGFREKQITVVENNVGIITLAASPSKLDEVQIIAYGTTSKRLSTGNTATIKAEEIEKQPVSNPLLALQGRVPGLFITQATGYANSGVTIRIQGRNSINNGNDPLYVIDGVPFESQLITTFNPILGQSGAISDQNGRPAFGNPLSFINPNDIESIDILKDADATAIYGSRAANGAILITTKKGKPGKLKVDLTAQNGWGQVASKLKLLNTAQYLQMRKEAFNNDGLSADSLFDYDLFNNYGWSSTRSADWQKYLIGNTARYQNYQSTLSGGSENVQFLLSGTYKKETAVIPGDFADQKAGMHFSANATSLNKKLKLLFTAGYLADNNQLPPVDLTAAAVNLPPNAPNLYNSDGTVNWALNSDGASTWLFYLSPIAELLNRYTNKTNNLNANTTLSYSIIPGLDIKSSFGYNKIQTDETILYTLAAIPPADRPFSKGSMKLGNSSNTSWIIEPQLSYRKTFQNIKLDALVGGTVQERNSLSRNISGNGYTNDELLGELANAAEGIILNFSNKNEYRYNAYFARVNVNYADEFIINATARRDGSSRFGGANQYHTFGSLGGAWIFTNRNYIQQNIEFLSFGKLRASYGTTGSDQIPDYKFLSLYTATFNLPYQGIPGLIPSSLTNPFIQWEETKKLQVGLDLGFLRDRIIFGINYNRNSSSNQLVNYLLPAVTGSSGVFRNFPATVRNTGWELTLSTINLKTKDFNWSTNFNITVPKNKLTKFPGLETSSYASFLIIGQPLSITKVYDLVGVNANTGNYEFKTSDGSLTTTPNDPADKNVLKNTDPQFYGGLQNTFTYKAFSLEFLFQFTRAIAVGYKFGNALGNFGGASGNQPDYVLNRWKKAGDITSVRKPSATFDAAYQTLWASSSNAAYDDASYARLKNLSLNWNVPQKWLNNISMASAQIFMQGQNLLTITNYTGLDPESASLNVLPPIRMVTVGIKATF
jgi:TonB-dependent starch-binding outer membrane protein SusC